MRVQLITETCFCHSHRKAFGNYYYFRAQPLCSLLSFPPLPPPLLFAAYAPSCLSASDSLGLSFPALLLRVCVLCVLCVERQQRDNSDYSATREWTVSTTRKRETCGIRGVSKKAPSTLYRVAVRICMLSNEGEKMVRDCCCCCCVILSTNNYLHLQRSVLQSYPTEYECVKKLERKGKETGVQRHAHTHIHMESERARVISLNFRVRLVFGSSRITQKHRDHFIGL